MREKGVKEESESESEKERSVGKKGSVVWGGFWGGRGDLAGDDLLRGVHEGGKSESESESEKDRSVGKKGSVVRVGV